MSCFEGILFLLCTRKDAGFFFKSSNGIARLTCFVFTNNRCKVGDSAPSEALFSSWMWGLHFVRSPAWNGLFGVSPISDLEFLHQVEFVWINFVWAGHSFDVKWFNNQRGWFAFNSFGFNVTILMVLNATIIAPCWEAFVVVNERRLLVLNPYNSKMKRFAMERFHNPLESSEGCGPYDQCDNQNSNRIHSRTNSLN